MGSYILYCCQKVCTIIIDIIAPCILTIDCNVKIPYFHSGVDIAQMLEYMSFSEKYVDLVRNSSAGNWAVTYALYKIFTPLRYTVTVGTYSIVLSYIIS